MKRKPVRRGRSVLVLLVAVTLFGLVPAAYGTTLYAANNGFDGPICGSSATPCRSITRTMANAASGDTIMVRAGVYSADLNHNGVLNEPGEEVLTFGGMVTMLKPLNVLSSDGAAATFIDTASVRTNSAVLIVTGNAEFGRPDHGFTVIYGNNLSNAIGIAIQGTDIKVRGNQVINTSTGGETGIQTQDTTETILIDSNQVMRWNAGIIAKGSNKTVSKNQVWQNRVGIYATGGSVVANVATGNSEWGILLGGTTSAIGNAAYGNYFGFQADPGFTGVIQKNNIFGNVCGLVNDGSSGVVATHNFWGLSTGPGADPADTVCNIGVGTTTTTPFANSRFTVNPSFDP